MICYGSGTSSPEFTPGEIYLHIYILLMNGSIYIHFNDSSSTVVGTVGVLL